MSNTIEVTTSIGHGLNKGDIVVFSNDTYFNNIITDIKGATLSIRKIKWYEDKSTAFLLWFVTAGLIDILLIFERFYR